ncbi:MAG: BatA domain-containing protein [Planctomycetaceae bacterium]|nr:BatA domain-containing protein [Planctomycetaceae bacterium]
MTLLHPGILLGLALVAVPLIVHLLMRQKPKKLVFPALQLLQRRRKQNSRRLRLRHVWLLLLRMLAIALVVFAIARPTLPAANFALSPREWLTLAFVIATAVAVYSVMLLRWRRQFPPYVYATRRSALRGWTTGATLLALLLLVGWPYQRRVAAEMTAPAPDARIDVPVAAICLFDTSLSMGYQQAGKTRLDMACQIAREHVGVLPDGSKLAVADDASDNPVVFQSTLASALARIDDLELHAATLPLNERVRASLQSQGDDRRQLLQEQGETDGGAQRDRYVRRVYVFTDMAASAWRGGGSQLLQEQLDKLENVQMFVIDVGELQPQNVAVSAVSVSRQRIAKGGSLLVGATIESIGLPPGERVVELTLTDGGRPPIGPLKRTVALETGAPQRIEFDLLSALSGPVIQGEVRLVSGDPLTADDTRYLSVDVGPAPKVLVIAPTAAQAQFWMDTLNPGEETRFESKYGTPPRLTDANLDDYDAVCLINVPQPTDDQWQRLGRFVDAGGGLAIFLGVAEEELSLAYNRAQAQAFLPARLDAYSAKGAWRLQINALEHPVFRKIREFADRGAVGVLQGELEINRFWKVTPTDDTAVIASYSDDDHSPAILARNHGKGRVVMITTAVDSKHFRREWNTLTKLVNSWAWLALAHPLVEHLARLSDATYTVDAGEAVTIPLPSGDPVLLRRPNLTQTTRTPKPATTQLIIDDADILGHYTLVQPGNGPTLAGFSVNPPAGESNFTRLEPAQLDELFGADRYQVARDIQELQSNVNLAVLGKEVFSVLMVLVIVAFCGEHLVANRFYESDQDDGERGQDSGFRIQGKKTAESLRAGRTEQAKAAT